MRVWFGRDGERVWMAGWVRMAPWAPVGGGWIGGGWIGGGGIGAAGMAEAIALFIKCAGLWRHFLASDHPSGDHASGNTKITA